MGIGLTALSLAGGLYGGFKSAQQNKRAQGLYKNMRNRLRDRRNELQTWFNTEYNKSFMDTAEAKSAVRTLTEQAKRNRKYAEGRRAITGGTDEAVVASMGKSGENFAAALNQLLGNATARKDSVRREFAARDANLSSQEMNLDQLGMNLEMGKNQNWMNFMSNAANLGSTAAMLNGMKGGTSGNSLGKGLLESLLSKQLNGRAFRLGGDAYAH